MKVIPYRNLPARPPLVATLVLSLGLDRIHAPGWLWGAVGVVIAFAWFAYFYAQAKQEPTELWQEPKEPKR
jgi:hypothetical protein